MTTPKLSAIGKGQYRCNECKKPCSIKSGAWHVRGGQQVFLCGMCDKPKRVESVRVRHA